VSYSEEDLQRYIDEPAKRPGRTEFARDRARIIHSFALRRLAAKTQVAVPWATDFPRTRLSHSLECAQVGRELGNALGADPDLMEGACLAHDIGHSPFGHNGESILNEIASDIGGFEGNAQSFRLLTRIEAKTVDKDGISVGLNLTRASLDAATKYPWPNTKNTKKFGVYEDDLTIFDWVRHGAPVGQQVFEAQLMDWSDDVAYSVHDLEDGLVTRQIKLKDLTNDIKDIYAADENHHLSGMTIDEVEAALTRLQALTCWPTSYDGSHSALARLKDLTSQLIGRFANSAEKATRAKYGDAPLIRYSANLEVPRVQRIEVGLLKAISGFYIINSEKSAARYDAEQNLLNELVDAVKRGAPGTLESFFIQEWERAGTDAEKMRVVIDQVASLTDPGAIALHAKLR
jgi:dGTPase